MIISDKSTLVTFALPKVLLPFEAFKLLQVGDEDHGFHYTMAYMAPWESLRQKEDWKSYVERLRQYFTANGITMK